MKFCSKLLVLAILASTCALISCAGPANTTSSYQNVSMSMYYYPDCNSCGTTGTGGFVYGINPPGDGGITGVQASYPSGATPCTTTLCQTQGAIEMPPGGGSGSCIELGVSVTNAPLNPTWSIIPAPVPSSATSNVGTLSATTGPTVFYCEANGIPIYSSTTGQLAQSQAAGLPQGTVEVLATNPSDPTGLLPPVSAKMYFTFQLLAPPTGIAVGFNYIAAGNSITVPLGGTYTFQGYVAGIGAINTCPTGSGPAYGVTYNVNTVPGGAGTGAGQFGTVTPANSTSGANVTYTAPTAYPSSTVHAASVTVSSTACPTIISSAITVNFP